MTQLPTHPFALVLSAVVIVGAALVGCSSSDSGSDSSSTSGGKIPEASVASLPGSKPSASTYQAPAEGPLIRVDTSAEEVERFQKAHRACPQAHGIPPCRTVGGSLPQAQLGPEVARNTSPLRGLRVEDAREPSGQVQA